MSIIVYSFVVKEKGTAGKNLMLSRYLNCGRKDIAKLVRNLIG